MSKETQLPISSWMNWRCPGRGSNSRPLGSEASALLLHYHAPSVHKCLIQIIWTHMFQVSEISNMSLPTSDSFCLITYTYCVNWIRAYSCESVTWRSMLEFWLLMVGGLWFNFQLRQTFVEIPTVENCLNLITNIWGLYSIIHSPQWYI